MARTWLVDGRGIATKVKNAALPSISQIKDCGANRECPKCRYCIDNSDVSYEWPGLPAGVKFDPSDIEILEHLAAKCGEGNSKPHMFIDEFIPTLEGCDGICYTHPENLPGAKKDGSSVHFFHRTTKAYATGQRKRRKIHSQHSSTKEQVRWHKTGKTKPVIDNGVQKGFKKIMVLYKTSVKGSKPDKSNWVMHQYHLGTDEDEKESQYVVSKISYQQQKQTDKNDNAVVTEETDMGMNRSSPRTPKTNTPNPPRPGKSVSCDDVIDDFVQSPSQEAAECIKDPSNPSSSHAQFKDDTEYPFWLAGESQAADMDDLDALLAGESQAAGVDGLDDLLCNEIFDLSAPLDDSIPKHAPLAGFARNTNDVPGVEKSSSCRITDLENIELGTPPDFQLGDLQFNSQDSIFDVLDWL